MTTPPDAAAEPARAPDRPGPATPELATALDVGAICPYLVASQGGWRSASPNRDHRCFAVDPPGASLDDFGWRVSIAELRASGPFSAFPGCERLILQLDGAPVTLRHDDGVVHPLAPLAPYRFSGERPTFGALGAGPARDFNVITRRARWSATLEVVHLAPGQEATVAVPAAALVHAHRGSCAVTFDDASRDLADGDAAIAHGDGVLTLAAGAQHALVLAVALRAMPAEHRA